MKNQSVSEIICILDKSGSMQSLQSETIAGLNKFIKEQQQQEGICHFSLVQFNQEISTTIKRQPISDVRYLTAASYQPDGYTALLDAVGSTLQKAMETQFFLSNTSNPARVLVFIITDGMENASTQYTNTRVGQMIRDLKDNKGWEFQFFGANIDAFGEAENIGISREKASQWAYNKEGVNYMMNEISEKSTEFRKRKI
jgi:uncharacterized protein YegL